MPCLKKKFTAIFVGVDEFDFKGPRCTGTARLPAKDLCATVQQHTQPLTQRSLDLHLEICAQSVTFKASSCSARARCMHRDALNARSADFRLQVQSSVDLFTANWVRWNVRQLGLEFKTRK